MNHLRSISIIATLALTAWVYWGCLKSPFHFDDSLFLASSQITEPGNVWRILNPAQGRQLTYLTYFLNYRIGRANPAGYHLINLLLHFANVAGVFLFCRAALRAYPHASRKTIHDGLPFGAAAVFALHPVQSESVNYIYQRATLLAALFSLTSLTLFIASERARSRRRFLVFSCIFYICAVASKESALVLPVAFMAYLWTHAENGGSLKMLMLRKRWLLLPQAVLMIAGAGWIFYVFHRPGVVAAGFGTANLSPFRYSVTQMQVILTYLRLLIWPSGLSLDHDYPVALLSSPFTWFSLFVVIGLVILAFCLRRQNPALSFFALVFLVFLAPTSSIIPSADLMFEHRLYLPMTGASPLLAWVILHGSRLIVRKDNWRAPASIALLGAIVAAYAAVARQRTHIWGDNIRLWEDAAAKAPRKARPHYNLGVAYLSTSRSKAREAFLKVVELRPDHAPALYNLGWLEQTSGRLDSARNYYLAALHADPDHWQTHHNLGNIAVVLGNIPEAIRQFQDTIRLQGDYWPAYQSLGTLLIQQRRYREAAETIGRLKQLRPDLLDAHYLMAYALLGEGRQSEAEEELRILSIRDTNGDFKERIAELRRTSARPPR